VLKHFVIKGVFASWHTTLMKIALPSCDDAQIIEDRTGIECSGLSASARNEGRLSPMHAVLFQCEFKEFCGPSRFCRFVEVLHLGRRQQQRLRYWQERILTAFTDRFPEYCGMTVPDVIAALEICHILRSIINRTGLTCDPRGEHDMTKGGDHLGRWFEGARPVALNDR
jgi:hypothetical protein